MILNNYQFEVKNWLFLINNTFLIILMVDIDFIKNFVFKQKFKIVSNLKIIRHVNNADKDISYNKMNVCKIHLILLINV